MGVLQLESIHLLQEMGSKENLYNNINQNLPAVCHSAKSEKEVTCKVFKAGDKHLTVRVHELSTLNQISY